VPSIFTKWYPEYRRVKYGPPAGQTPCPAPTDAASTGHTHQQKSRTMKDVFARLGADFFSTILFFLRSPCDRQRPARDCVAIAGAIAQVIYSRVKGKPLG